MAVAMTTTEEGGAGVGDSPMPHVVMVSFPAQGHLNPLLRLAKRVAAKGLLVTLCSTDDIARRIAAAASTSVGALADPTRVGRGFIRFEFFSDGIAPDDPVRHLDFDFFMAALRSAGPPALAALVRRQVVPVACIVSNPYVPWVLDVAADLGLPRGVLWVQSAAVFSIYYHYHHALATFPSEDNPDVTVQLPGLPPLRPEDLPTFLLWTSPYQYLKIVILDQFSNLSNASWVFANTFDELEHEAIEAISHHQVIIPIGPLVDPPAEEGGSKEIGGGEIKADLFKAADESIQWLARHPPRSVVYVSVGSVVVLTEEEMEEVAWGLKQTGQPFLWVVRSDARERLPAGFAEAVEAEGIGMLVEWSPQERVLEHQAVACFLTHCGWNSTMEALTAGVPVVAYPQFGDQVPDAKMLAEACGVGVRLPAPATRAELQRCVKAVTEGETAEAIRRRASEWKEAAVKAVSEGGSSDRHIQAFVDDLTKRAARPTN
ncbi:gallate 1-beta-glucosyltransferase-like [Curcuma longa]|uniref:gallate 1-beta-glucosyltransferase-like n=1 Tax=Curcuma longa TaxID=136217 RepID=UPI003D9F59E2